MLQFVKKICIRALKFQMPDQEETKEPNENSMLITREVQSLLKKTEDLLLEIQKMKTLQFKHYQEL